MTAEPRTPVPRVPGKLAAVLLALGLAACAAPSARDAPQVQAMNSAGLPDRVREEVGFAVLDPETVIQDDWRHQPLRGTTDYRMAFVDGRLAIRAEPSGSASGLIRRIAIDPSRCPVLEWSWRVERLQQGADLRLKEADDVAASIHLLFGEPQALSNPLPTLRYVWTNGQLAHGAVVDSPTRPGTVFSVVVENGDARLGAWVTERRNIRADFWRAFGRAPGAPVSAIAIFTDNDQTGEPVVAHYGLARTVCSE